MPDFRIILPVILSPEAHFELPIIWWGREELCYNDIEKMAGSYFFCLNTGSYFFHLNDAQSPSFADLAHSFSLFDDYWELESETNTKVVGRTDQIQPDTICVQLFRPWKASELDENPKYKQIEFRCSPLKEFLIKKKANTFHLSENGDCFRIMEDQEKTAIRNVVTFRMSSALGLTLF